MTFQVSQEDGCCQQEARANTYDNDFRSRYPQHRSTNLLLQYAEYSKKRRITGEPMAKKTTGMVTDHYFNFTYDTLEVLNRHEQYKGCYLLVDNAPIHSSNQIRRFFKRRYGCVYLSPYLSERNPIELLWSMQSQKKNFLQRKLLS